jgi:hypothetical protein
MDGWMDGWMDGTEGGGEGVGMEGWIEEAEERLMV